MPVEQRAVGVPTGVAQQGRDENDAEKTHRGPAAVAQAMIAAHISIAPGFMATTRMLASAAG